VQDQPGPITGPAAQMTNYLKNIKVKQE